METKYNFIERTQKILHQYDKFVPQNEDYFDVTLLLNCCVGLLLVSNEKGKNTFLRKDKKTLKEWNINESDITLIRNGNLENEKKTLFNVCKHLRNSIAHCLFSAFAEGSGKTIDKIEFKDFLGENHIPEKQTFQYSTSVADFKLFLQKLSTEANFRIKF